MTMTSFVLVVNDKGDEDKRGVLCCRRDGENEALRFGVCLALASNFSPGFDLEILTIPRVQPLSYFASRT